ncbi:MAG: hypothetical protein K6E58_02920 [Eubacterium sp.]|nr:hypothetical protein [Eubacterium sp.]
MKKRNRGLIAIVCIMALLISSFATYTAVTKASQSDAAAYDWTQENYISSVGTNSQTYVNKFKVHQLSGGNWGNQKQVENAEYLYMNLSSAAFSTVKLNGNTLTLNTDYKTDGGALVKIYLSALGAKYNDLVIYGTDGTTVFAETYIYYVDGTESETVTQSPAPTTTSAPQTDYSTLNYLGLNPIKVYDHQNSKVAIAYAVCEDESTSSMALAAANWEYSTYGDNYVKIAWGDQSPYASPSKIAINGTEYTNTSGPIVDYASTLVNINAMHSAGFTTGYNTVKITKGSEYVTIVYRVGSVVAPTACTATAQVGVPGSMNVTWTPGSGAPAEQVYRVYVDDDMKRGNLTGTSSVVNNIEAGTHTVKVVGYYLGQESEGPTATVSISAGVKYSQDISVEGFQIRSNYPDGTTPSSVAYRTMCKAPKAGSTVKAGGKTYTVASVGTIYALDTNTRDKDGTNVLDASYTLLNETPITGEDYHYTGYRTYQGVNKTFGYLAGPDAVISDYKAGDTDNTYYAFTMQNMDEFMANTIWVRPFVVANDSAGTIIYGKSTAFTSVAEIANVLYTNSMCKNKTSHDYLYSAILNNSRLQQAQNPFYRTTEITYGWNGNLYIGFRKVPDSWNSGTGIDEGTYVPVGDWRIHNTSHYNETITTSDKKAAASYKGNTNDEMEVRVDNPGAERRTEGFLWNWGIQMKLANQIAYHRLEDGRKYRMTITYNTTKAGIMRIKTEGNCAANKYGDEGYWQDGHDLVYDFDAVAGGNSNSVEFTYDKNKYEKNPGADPSIVICPGVFNVYPFGEAGSSTYGNDCRAMLHIKYKGQYKDTTSTVEDVGGFPAGTIISNVDVTFTEIDDFAPDSPNVLH